LLRTLIKIRWQGEDVSIFHRWIVAFSMLRNIDGTGMIISTCNSLFLQVGPLSLSLWSSICVVLPRFSLNYIICEGTNWNAAQWCRAVCESSLRFVSLLRRGSVLWSDFSFQVK
jgi:hypothetical protein